MAVQDRARVQNRKGGGGKLDAAFYDDLEEVLLTADVGVETTQALIERMKDLAQKRNVSEVAEAKALMQEAAREILAQAQPGGAPAKSAARDAAGNGEGNPK